MKTSFLIILICLFSCVSSCSIKSGNCGTDFSRLLDKVDVDFIIFLPVEGCSSCIDETMKFVSENSESSNLKVFLHASQTKISDFIKKDRFNQIDFVRTLRSLDALPFNIDNSDSFPLLIDLREENCSPTLLNASNIKKELSEVYFDLKRSY